MSRTDDDITARLRETLREAGDGLDCYCSQTLLRDALAAIEQRDAEIAQLKLVRARACSCICHEDGKRLTAERDALRAERDRLQNELDNYALDVVSLRAELGRVKAEECLRALAPEEPQR